MVKAYSYIPKHQELYMVNFLLRFPHLLIARRFCAWGNSGRFWWKLGRPHGQDEEYVDNGLAYILFSVFKPISLQLKKILLKMTKLRATSTDV